MNRIVKPMPQAAEHAPLSVLNRTGQGIRTLIVCSCEWCPRKASERGSTMHLPHAAHLRTKGMPRADYSGVVFGEGPWMGLTWDEWHAEHGAEGLDPYTGEVDPHSARGIALRKGTRTD